MTKKRWIQLISAVAILATPIFFQNCSPQHGEGSGDFSSRILLGAGQCDQILILAWEPYRDQLATSNMCLNCHTGGGSAGKPFADLNNDTSIQSLLDEGVDKIWSFAINPGHKAGFTGPQNEPILQPLHDAYLAAETEYASCLADAGSAPVPGDGLPDPTIRSANVAVPDAQQILDNPQQLDFTVNGYAVSIEVAAWETDLGNRGYDISVPTITANGTTMYVRNMGIYINDVLVPAPAGSAFQNVDRYVAAGTTRALFSTGVMNVTYDTLGANVISVAFEVVQDAPGVTFTPATYTQLVNGVFANNCAGCHGGANPDGGISLDSANSYTLNYLNGLFTPFDENSSIYQEVLLDRMPQGGAPLSPADKELIKGWILDGAPIN